MSRGGNDPAYAREKDIRRRQCAENPLDNTSDEVPKLQVEESTSFWTKLRSPSIQCASCIHRPLGGPPSACTWVWFHLETNMPKCRRANSGVLIMEPAEKYVSECDGPGGTSDAVPN